MRPFNRGVELLNPVSHSQGAISALQSQFEFVTSLLMLIDVLEDVRLAAKVGAVIDGQDDVAWHGARTLRNPKRPPVPKIADDQSWLIRVFGLFLLKLHSAQHGATKDPVAGSPTGVIRSAPALF